MVISIEKLRVLFDFRKGANNLDFNFTQPFLFTFTSTGNLVSPINLHVFELWEKTRSSPGRNPCRHRVNSTNKALSNPGGT